MQFLKGIFDNFLKIRAKIEKSHYVKDIMASISWFFCLMCQRFKIRALLG